MPQCAFKSCKNNVRNCNTTTAGVSYFRFPSDPIRCSEWTAIVARERAEEFYQPAKYSVICSKHFVDFDKTGKSKRRRLLKAAVPKLEIVSSVADKPDTDAIDVDNNRREKIIYDPRPVILKKVPSSSIASAIIREEPKKPSLKKTLTSVVSSDIKIKNKNNNLQKIRKRKEKSNSSLKNIVKLLQKQQTLDGAAIIDLSKYIEAADVFNRFYLQRFNLLKSFSKYPKGARKFALTLYLHAPSTYKYIRKMFNTCLPQPKTLCEWYRGENAAPGFCAETLSKLQSMVTFGNKSILCALIVGEMSIKRQKVWTGQRYAGLVDMGLGSNDDNQTASQAYVFMLVSINDTWKLPIAYFFCDGIQSKTKTNLIGIALEKCANIGVEIRSVTLNSSKSNIATMLSLGCELDDLHNLKTNFTHPSDNHNVVVLLDPSHMLRLMRNTLESNKILYVNNKKPIKWKFISDLVNMKIDSTANKICHKYVNVKNKIINTKLTSQLLSKNVADTLKICDKTLKIPDFQDSDSTVEFIKILNKLYNVLNTRNFKDVGVKMPLSNDNSEEILWFLIKTSEYLLSLNIQVKSRKIPLVKTANNSGLLGILVCIESLICLYSNLVETDVLPFLMSYKLSQDHVEQFFNIIRSQSGSKCPSTRQFKASFKNVLTNLEHYSKIEDTLLSAMILNETGSSSLDKINETSLGYSFDETEQINISQSEVLNNKYTKQSFERYQANCNELASMLNKRQSKDIISQIVGYISGFIAGKLVKKLHCEECKSSLMAIDKQWFHKLIDLKDMGGILYTSKDVFDICMKTEETIRFHVVNGIKSIQNKSKMSVLESFISKDVFVERNYHNHNVFLIKSIVEHFIDVRLQYTLGKNAGDIKNRPKLQLFTISAEN